jgi:hypothetical protein
MTNAVHNPKNLPIKDLPVIYGFNNGGSPEWYDAVLLAQDGTFLGSHICSHEAYMPGDLGVEEGSRADRHEHFRAHYPNGYKMEFVSRDDISTHVGLQEAFRLNSLIIPEEKQE